jgi:hypothetical protein
MDADSRMSYLIAVAGAILIGTVSGLATEFLNHSRWASIVVGLATATATFLLGTAKAIVEIVDKRLDIARKKSELEHLKAIILVPSEGDISNYGGVVYREVARKAHLIVNQREHVRSQEFVSSSSEERSQGESA